ncbi:MAG: hypothetical protein HYR94_15795 [Chloroflexi bacterium]|nr:hypothetical protein [Chloroflexota bacterium]
MLGNHEISGGAYNNIFGATATASLSGATPTGSEPSPPGNGDLPPRE